jgi:hypothetical protein
MRLNMRPDSDLLRVDATGEFSLDEAKRTFLEMMEAVSLHKTTRVLFDGRTVTGSPETMERFYYGEFAAQTVLQYQRKSGSRTPRFAYVLREPVLDPQKFGETVAVNRGMVIKVCDNIEEALEWLSITSAKAPEAGGGK